MRITTGTGNSKITVAVPQGETFRRQPYHERQQFERQFCQLAGISRTAPTQVKR